MNDQLNNYDRLIVVMSDIEMGAGGPFDDFPHSAFLGQFLRQYTRGQFAETPVDIVFNGDTFDLLKTSYLDSFPHLITSDIAIAKMTRVIAAHPKFFEAIRAFLAHNIENRVHFIVGNHDSELFFPEVQTLLANVCGVKEQVSFPGFSLVIGDVHFEHGQQSDEMFKMDPDKLFINSEFGRILNVSWASVVLSESIIPLQPYLYALDRFKPKVKVFELMPEVKELLTSTFWRYWSRDFVKDILRRDDPMKKISWSMFREMIKQFTSVHPDVVINEDYHHVLESDKGHRLYFLGHAHQPFTWSYGDRKVIQTGCIRDEFMLDETGENYRLIPKSYAHVYMRNDCVERSELLEFTGPMPPEGHIPKRIFDILPHVEKLLAELKRDKSSDDEKLISAEDSGAVPVPVMLAPVKQEPSR